MKRDQYGPAEPPSPWVRPYKFKLFNFRKSTSDEILPPRKSLRLQRFDPDGVKMPDLPPPVCILEPEHVSLLI